MVIGMGAGTSSFYGKSKAKGLAENSAHSFGMYHNVPVRLELYCCSGNRIYRNKQRKFQKADDVDDDLDVILCSCIFYIY